MKQITTQKLLKNGIHKEGYQILGVIEDIQQSDTSDRNKYVVADTTGRIDCIYWNDSLLKGIDTGTEVMIAGLFNIYEYTDKKTGQPGTYKSLTFKEENIEVMNASYKLAEDVIEQPIETFKVRALAPISEKDSTLVDDIINILKATIEDLGMLKPVDEDVSS